MPRNAEWERVLALVEAEAEYAETLLALPHDAPIDDVLVPPSVLPTRTGLPPLREMPALSPELRERAAALQERIEELQHLLAAALQGSHWHFVTPPAPVTAATPQFLDRRV